MTPGADDVSGERKRLVGIARRILGSTAEAESAADLSIVRWQALSPEERAATGSRADRLTEILARVCLERFGATPARAVVGAAASPPADQVTLDDSMYMLLLVVLDSLTPGERVAFILHDVFAVPYAVVADVVGRSPEAARDLARSARRQIQQQRQRETPADRHDEVVREALHAIEAGDEGRLRALLHDDVTLLVDTGGRADASAAPVVGARRVARLVTSLAARSPEHTVTAQPVNDRLGLVARRGRVVVGVAGLRVEAGRIRDIWLVLAPAKLRRWNLR